MRVADSVGLETGAWQIQPLNTYLGNIEEQVKVITLRLTNLTDPEDTLDLPCRRTTVAASSADAVHRASSPAAWQECGDRGRWHPEVTRSRVTSGRGGRHDSAA